MHDTGSASSVGSLTTPLSDAALRELRTGDQLSVSGTIYTALDVAHLRMVEDIRAERPLPFDPDGQVVYFSGPAPAPPGRILGPAGPTTGSRMDPYSPYLIERGLKAMIAKGQRSAAVRRHMRRAGCVYLGAVEGTAALLAERVSAVSVVGYPELGAQAIHRLTVADFKVVVINDLYGGDLYDQARAEWRGRGRSVT